MLVYDIRLNSILDIELPLDIRVAFTTVIVLRAVLLD